MTIFPVAERELRVAARERNTYRVRFLAAFVAVLFSGFSLWFVTLLGGRPIPARELFIALSCIEFVFVLLAGFSLTADSVSEEKRESTLGLLFLTDLRGYDIVLGKLVAALIRGVYALVATIPVLALPLMMGGAGLREFGQIALTLTLSLVFSICLGLFFSTFAKRSWTAYGLSAAGMLFFAAILPAYSEFVRSYFSRPFEAVLIELPSPTCALRMSFGAGGFLSQQYWMWSILTLAACAVAMLAVSSATLPNIWKDRPPRGLRLKISAAFRRFKYGSDAFRLSLRRRLLALNPVLWLSRRERISSLGLLLAITALLLAAWGFITQPFPLLPLEPRLVLSFICWMFTAGLTHALILLRLPALAAERFSDDRKSGALELLVSTPLTVKEILRGHWLGLLRYFWGPALLSLLIHIVPVFYLVGLQPILGRRGQTFSALFGEIIGHFNGDPIPNDWENHNALIVMLGIIPLIILTWIALAWLSAYLSLRVKRPLAIPPFAIMALHGPPLLLLGGIAALAEYNRWRFEHEFTTVVFFEVLGFLLSTASLCFWTWHSRRKLLATFRQAATDRYESQKKRWWQKRIA